MREWLEAMPSRGINARVLIVEKGGIKVELSQSIITYSDGTTQVVEAGLAPDLMCGHPVGTFGHIDGCPDEEVES